MNKITKSLLKSKKEQNRERVRSNQRNAEVAEMDGHINSENIVSPVIEMEQNRVMPLYIFIGNLKAPKIGDTKMNYMCMLPI